MRVGTVPENLGGAGDRLAGIQVADGALQLEVPGVARYRVGHARDVVIEPMKGAAPEEVRLFLFGTVLGALLHLRGQPPLHASAVLMNGRAVVFCGRSGAGKSTLAAELSRRGYPLLSDDTGVVGADEAGRPIYHPGVPRIRLWRDALDHFGIATDGLTQDRRRDDKFHLPLPGSAQGGPEILERIYFLEPASEHEPVTITSLAPRQGVPFLMGSIYRRDLARRLGTVANQFQYCAWIGDEVSLRRFSRPWSLDALDDAVDELEADLLRERRQRETAEALGGARP